MFGGIGLLLICGIGFGRCGVPPGLAGTIGRMIFNMGNVIGGALMIMSFTAIGLSIDGVVQNWIALPAGIGIWAGTCIIFLSK